MNPRLQLQQNTENTSVLLNNAAGSISRELHRDFLFFNVSDGAAPASLTTISVISEVLGCHGETNHFTTFSSKLDQQIGATSLGQIKKINKQKMWWGTIRAIQEMAEKRSDVLAC